MNLLSIDWKKESMWFFYQKFYVCRFVLNYRSVLFFINIADIIFSFSSSFLRLSVLKTIIFAALSATANAGAVQLTAANFDAEVIDSGKSGFVKFLAPW